MEVLESTMGGGTKKSKYDLLMMFCASKVDKVRKGMVFIANGPVNTKRLPKEVYRNSQPQCSYVIQALSSA